MTDTNPQAQADVQSLVHQLSETIHKIDKDDLSILAQMHGWCEGLVQTFTDQEDSEAAPLLQQSKTIGESLEQLILGEVEDAENLLGNIANAINELQGLVAGSCSNVADLAAAPEDTPTLSEEEAQQEGNVDSAAAAETPQAASDESATDTDAAETSNDDNIVGETKAEAAEGEQKEETPGYESVPLYIDPKELEFVKAFVEEAQEHIEAIETGLIEVEREPGDTAKIDDLFRPFHTIKGMAGFLNLRDINYLTHEVETLLDQGRKGNRAMTAGIIDLVFQVIDVLKEQVTSVGNYVANPTGDAVYQPHISELIELLRDVVAGKHEPGNTDTKTISETAPAPRAADQQEASPAATTESPEKPGAEENQAANDTSDQQATSSENTQKQPSAAPASRSQAAADSSIRIETSKLDALVDMVGELVIAQTLIESNDGIKGDAKLNKDIGQVTKIVRDVQEVAMSMRMVPIGPTFNKMARLVRDVSRKGNKKVDLVINGEDTELDKNVIQQISDPLVHMVRNAVDHGVERADERRAAGKEETGQVCLSAYHHGGNIVIEISDDGKGLDPEALIQKAKDKGIVQPGEELTDEQAYALIFAPGFSTAQEITDISGRGVGMDVVRRNIEQLRGRIDITSEKGNGTTFAIRLPLTLAIIDGMVVRVGSEKFIIPTITIEQSLRPTPEQITSVQQKGEVLNVRGQLIPLIQLGNIFKLSGPTDPCQTMVVIVQSEGRQVGLVVDDLLGQQQVVIKTLGQRFEKLQGICGAAILGDGRVGLILEMSGLAKLNETADTSSVCGRNQKKEIASANKTGQDTSSSESEKPLHEGNTDSATN